jgi:hypothetical protein
LSFERFFCEGLQIYLLLASLRLPASPAAVIIAVIFRRCCFSSLSLVLLKSLMLLTSLWLLDSLLLPRHAAPWLLPTSVIFVLFLLLLSTLLLPGFRCCWRPWRPAIVFFLAVDCFPSVAGAVADEPFLAAFLMILAFPLILLPCLLLLASLPLLASLRLLPPLMLVGSLLLMASLFQNSQPKNKEAF